MTKKYKNFKFIRILAFAVVIAALISCLFTINCAAMDVSIEETVQIDDDVFVEEDVLDPYMPVSPFGFWFCFILIGFILPIPFLILGLVFPRSEKMGYPKYWYSLSISAGFWILISTIILILVVSIV